MGQKLRDDKIGVLSHSAGAITLTASSSNPSWLTIGGQQYRITSNLSRTIAIDLTMTANSLYMIYAVRNAGNTELRISANVNSVGPAGFVSWKLVGAFYSNGLVSVAFGSFVNIVGVSRTQNSVEGGVLIITAQSGGQAKGTTTRDRVQWWRDGSKIKGYYEFTQTSSGSSGTGNYLIEVPTNFLINTTKHSINTASFSGTAGSWNSYSKIGTGHIQVTASPGFTVLQPFSATQFRTWCLNVTTAGSATPGGWGSNFFAFAQTNMDVSCNIEFEAQGLTETAIEDL